MPKKFLKPCKITFFTTIAQNSAPMISCLYRELHIPIRSVLKRFLKRILSGNLTASLMKLDFDSKVLPYLYWVYDYKIHEKHLGI